MKWMFEKRVGLVHTPGGRQLAAGGKKRRARIMGRAALFVKVHTLDALAKRRGQFIIGLTGPSGVGKTEIIKHLMEQHGFESYHVGMPVKRALAEGFDLSKDEVDGKQKNESALNLGGVEPKFVLDHVGMAIARTAPLATALALGRKLDKMQRDKVPCIVIDGVRQPAEADLIHRRGGIVCRVDDGSGPDPKYPMDKFAWRIPVDHHLDTSGDLPHTKRQVDQLLAKYKLERPHLFRKDLGAGDVHIDANIGGDQQTRRRKKGQLSIAYVPPREDPIVKFDPGESRDARGRWTVATATDVLQAHLIELQTGVKGTRKKGETRAAAAARAASEAGKSGTKGEGRVATAFNVAQFAARRAMEMAPAKRDAWLRQKLQTHGVLLVAGHKFPGRTLDFTKKPKPQKGGTHVSAFVGQRVKSWKEQSEAVTHADRAAKHTKLADKFDAMASRHEGFSAQRAAAHQPEVAAMYAASAKAMRDQAARHRRLAEEGYKVTKMSWAEKVIAKALFRKDWASFDAVRVKVGQAARKVGHAAAAVGGFALHHPVETAIGGAMAYGFARHNIAPAIARGLQRLRGVGASPVPRGGGVEGPRAWRAKMLAEDRARASKRPNLSPEDRDRALAQLAGETPSFRDRAYADRAAVTARMVKGTVEQTMHEFKHGTLRSGSKRGPKVTDRKQAIAIALSQAGLSRG